MYFQHRNVLLTKILSQKLFIGDPKTKFLRHFLSAVRPFVLPKKTSPDFSLVCPPPSALGSILYRCLQFRAKQTVYPTV